MTYSYECTVAEGLGIGKPMLEDRTEKCLIKFGTPFLDGASENYWGYRGKSNRFNKALQEIPPIVSFENSSLFGIEVEIENVSYKREDDAVPVGWSKKGDGSLRNGVEYISWPANAAESRALIASLYLFFIEQLKKTPEFSWRTSIHVHLNVRPLTTQQLGNLSLLYCIFEFLLFRFAAPERMDNIFCVPVTDSTLGSKLNTFLNSPILKVLPADSLIYLFDGWDKYSALNFSRLRDLGTVEFRHMGGTWDTEKLGYWLNLIGALYDASVRLSREWIVSQLKGLNSLSNYGEFKQNIFGDTLSNILGEPDDFIQVLSHGVSFAKQCLVPMQNFERQIEKNSPADIWAHRLFEKFKQLPQDKETRKRKSIDVIIPGHSPMTGPLVWTTLENMVSEQASSLATSTFTINSL